MTNSGKATHIEMKRDLISGCRSSDLYVTNDIVLKIFTNNNKIIVYH